MEIIKSLKTARKSSAIIPFNRKNNNDVHKQKLFQYVWHSLFRV